MLQQENDSLRKEASWDRRSGAFHVCSPRHLDSGGCGGGVVPRAGAAPAPVLSRAASGIVSELQPAIECVLPSWRSSSRFASPDGSSSLWSPRSTRANARSEQQEEERKADSDEAGKEGARESRVEGDALRHECKREQRRRESSSPPVPSLSAASGPEEWSAKIFIPIVPATGAQAQQAQAPPRGGLLDLAWG